MKMAMKGAGTRNRVFLMGTTVLAGMAVVATLAVPALAQEAMETVTVTGYRASLQSAANAKREAANFSDSVFAEDIGKFPDLNIAEAINRVPGVRLSRDPSGEGVQVVVRGLGSSFTTVTMNNHQVEVATDGVEGSGNSNREVDLDMFPVELFTKINVNKTPVASMLEGGIAGTVNLSTAKPLDNDQTGLHVNYSLQDEYTESNGGFSPRGAVIASYNLDNKVGILFGVAAQHLQFRVDGYESVGEALAGISDQNSACLTTVCNTIGTGKNFHWATVVPPGVAADASMGIGATGTAYAYSGGLNTAGGTSGLSMAALSNAIWPYLPRESTKLGDRNRISTLLDLQYRASENLEFNLVTLFEDSQRNWATNEMDLFIRNSCNTAGTDSSCMIPENVKTDSLGYVTSAKLLNASWFFDPWIYRENVQFFDVNPTMDWTVTPWLKVHGAIDYNDSYLNRRAWSFQFRTAPGMGYTVNYNMSPGHDFPTMTTTAPVTDPTSSAWNWYRIQVQPLSRSTVGRSTNWDATIGDETANIKVGYNYNQYYRYIYARDWSTNANNCFINGTTCTLPDGTVNTTGSLKIPNSQLSQYLTAQPTGDFLGLSDGSQGFSGSLWNSSKLDQVTNIRSFVDNAPFSLSGALGAQKTGIVNEKTNIGYIEANATVKFLEHDIHMNGGVRYYNTDQKIVGPVLVSGNYVMTTVERTYDGYLPSFNVSADVYDNVVLRFAGSKSMTRPIPSQMLPGVSFGGALLSPVSAGNPNLAPYFSDNLDVGLEWYSGGPGVVAIDYFRKNISNYTQSTSLVEPFSATGIPLSVLSPTQLADYNANGGPNETVTVNTTVNLQQKLHLEGWEFQIVQPLDFWIEGAGVTANYTRITSHVDPGLTLAQAQGLATGVAPYSFNLGAYYENEDMSVHLTYNYIDKFISGATPTSQGIQTPQYSETHRQLDLSASYTLPWFKGTVMEGAQVTFDATNLTSAKQELYDGDTNAPNAVWYPGRAFIVGLRGKF